MYIIHGELPRTTKLKFMYYPFINSCLEISKILYKNFDCKYLYDKYDFNCMKNGDIIIFIGNINIPNFKYLKELGIYTIFYWTEPNTINNRCLNGIGKDPDEIWVYSKLLFNKHNILNKNQKIKFVPIICDTSVPFVNYSIPNNEMKLIFIGNIRVRHVGMEAIKMIP